MNWRCLFCSCTYNIILTCHCCYQEAITRVNFKFSNKSESYKVKEKQKAEYNIYIYILIFTITNKRLECISRKELVNNKQDV